MNSSCSRRGFLKLGLNTLAAGGLYGTLGGLQRALAASDTSGYRALVCVFLHGGNDSFNWLVPRDVTGYAEYAAARGTLALPVNSLLPLSGGGAQLGLHASCSGLQSLFNTGRAAFVGNVGTLVQPVTAAQVRNGGAELPRHLYSHSDQQSQWMTSAPHSTAPRGWAGRVADLLHAQSYNPRLAVNLSLGGSNLWQSGRDTVPYALGLDGAPEFRPMVDRSYRSGARSDLLLALQQQALGGQNRLARQLATTQSRAVELSSLVNDGIGGMSALQTAFPDTALGRQLHMAARMVQARDAIGVSRQMFFVSMGGWDTHDDQLVRQSTLLAELSAGISAFHAAMTEVGAEQAVTTFTASDFGRTLSSNGDGSDHGWGGHALVVGGAVNGGQIFGTLPSLAINGPDDAGWGRIVPTLATDQYAATLARWFGVAENDLDLVFPHLDRFSARDLGFMA
jgi:uncharacterized protein (DUF1501 family)